MAGPIPLLGLLDELRDFANRRNIGQRMVGGGVRGAGTRALLDLDLPEDATKAERAVYENTRRAAAPVMGLAAAPAAIKTAGRALKDAPRTQALETARQNAVKMLGLPENNTAMDRARAMGFRSEQFHETGADNLAGIYEQGFAPRKAVAAASDNETPYGVFTKDTGRSIGLARENEVQIPVLVRTNEGTESFRQFADREDLTNRLGVWNQEIASLLRAGVLDDKARAKQIDALGEMLSTRSRPGNSGMSNAEIWKQIDALASGDPALNARAKQLITDEFLKRGIETVGLAKDAGSMGRSVGTTISLNPANVRSRFAAFDPARMNENDLLASLAAAGVSIPMILGLLDEERVD